MVVRQDILGGLRVALARGKPLQETMQAFYNAGYSKEEIEEAARELNTERTPQQVPQKPNLPAKPVSAYGKEIPKSQSFMNVSQRIPNPAPTKPLPAFQESKISPQPSQPESLKQIPQKKPTYRPLIQNSSSHQVVSSYEQQQRGSGFDMVTIILVVLLLVLLGVLAAVFFYKDQLVSFLNQYLE